MKGPGSEHFPRSPLGESEANIPTGRDVEWEPLVDYRRFGVSETTIHGAALVFSSRSVARKRANSAPRNVNDVHALNTS